ncbi:hypothetical protein [Caulobacter sp. DWR1-3-2b1]|uniref:hypothetical protein n=1 Tax=Caulobacter sp. DWR1-3-2b1 TaxID=2804670 RepID=UPI003CEF360F
MGRPEMHAVHHERDVDAFNYCDLPVIDAIFGAYRNPRTVGLRTGTPPFTGRGLAVYAP